MIPLFLSPILYFKPDSQATRIVNVLGNITSLDDKIICPQLLPGELETFWGNRRFIAERGGKILAC
tara:strand:+ start:161 stop:358 length:198 start_codon:yes stop_codon:yes gene_type:complete